MSNKRVCDRCNAVFDEKDRALNSRWSRLELPDREFLDFCGKCTRIIRAAYPYHVRQLFHFFGSGPAGEEQYFPVQSKDDPKNQPERKL